MSFKLRCKVESVDGLASFKTTNQPIHDRHVRDEQLNDLAVRHCPVFQAQPSLSATLDQIIIGLDKDDRSALRPVHCAAGAAEKFGFAARVTYITALTAQGSYILKHRLEP
jgi:hypothetical protein